MTQAKNPLFKMDGKGQFKFKNTKSGRHIYELTFLSELSDYITNNQINHYSNMDENTGEISDTVDLISGITDVKPFLFSNVIKYISRYGMKNGKNKKDLFKAAHYIMMLAYYLDHPEDVEVVND